MLGTIIYGTDDDTLSSKAAELLIRNGWTIAAAESLTAGLFMAELADEPGISSSLEGGIVVYNEKAKMEQLGIEQSLLEGVWCRQCGMRGGSCGKRKTKV